MAQRCRLITVVCREQHMPWAHLPPIHSDEVLTVEHAHTLEATIVTDIITGGAQVSPDTVSAGFHGTIQFSADDAARCRPLQGRQGPSA